MTRTLVVGLPRSGTTWVARVLAASAGAGYLEEPDNHFRRAYAFRAKRRLGLGEYPLLAVDDERYDMEDYATLWRAAFAPCTTPAVLRARRRAADRLVRIAGAGRVSSALAGSRRSAPILRAADALAVAERALGAPDVLVVKSVHAPLSAEWIAGRHDARVAVVLRDPLNVVSSWLDLGWLGPRVFESIATLHPEAADALAARFDVPRPAQPSPLSGAAWLVGALTCALDAAAQEHRSWARVVHEELCERPSEGFATLAASLRLPWSENGDRMLGRMNRPGSGYELARVASELPDAWRSRLGADEVREIRATLERFPLPAATRGGLDAGTSSLREGDSARGAT